MKLQDLDESIRFGQREINEIDSKYGRRVLVGIEYEIEFPDEDKLNSLLPTPSDRSEELDQINKEIADKMALLNKPEVITVNDAGVKAMYDEELPRAIERLRVVKKNRLVNNELESLPGIVKLHVLEKSISDSHVIMNLVKSISTGGDVRSDLPTFLEVATNNITNELHRVGETVSSITNSDLDSFAATADGTEIPIPPELADQIKLIQDYIKLVFHLADSDNSSEWEQIVFNSRFKSPTVIGRIQRFGSEWEGHAYRRSVMNVLERKYEAHPPALSDEETATVRKTTLQSAKERNTTSNRTTIRRELVDLNERKAAITHPVELQGAVAIVQSYFSVRGKCQDEYGIDPDWIGDVTKEPSLENGAEVITKAIPLPDALDLMQKMFQFIKDKGATTEKTGMHMNVSIKGLHFIQDNFNAAKLIVLSDEEYITKYFPFRKWVESSFNPSEIRRAALDRLLYNLASVAGDKKTQFDLINSFITNSIVRVRTKHQTINTLSTESEYLSDLNQARVEFRFPGDADYETKYDQLRWFLYRSIQMLLAGFDENYGRNEYLKMGLAVINKKIATAYQKMSLGELVGEVRTMIKSGRISDASDVGSALQSIIYRSGLSRRSVALYQSRSNPTSFIVTEPSTNIVHWFDTENLVTGVENVKRLDLTKYKPIRTFKRPGDAQLFLSKSNPFTPTEKTPTMVDNGLSF